MNIHYMATSYCGMEQDEARVLTVPCSHATRY